MLIVSVLVINLRLCAFPFAFASRAIPKNDNLFVARQDSNNRQRAISYSLRIHLKLTMNSSGSTDSNQAVTISLVTPRLGVLQTLHSFHPKFTYAIFGDEERIFGYQDLKIHLRYNCCDMRPSVQILYNRKFKTVGETSAMDLKAVLEKFVPKSEHISVP